MAPKHRTKQKELLYQARLGVEQNILGYENIISNLVSKVEPLTN